MTQAKQDGSNHYIKGIITNTIFYNEENGYGVYGLKVTDSDDPDVKEPVTINGYVLPPQEEEEYICYGEWRNHPKYGKQYFVHRLEKEVPRTEQAIIKYLSSGLFYGVGQKTAKRIVDHFGTDVLERILSDPDKLFQVKGISTKQVKTIVNTVQENHALEQAMVFLYRLGLGSSLALKIVQLYKQDTLSILKENPFRLIDDVEGIGFHRADTLAKEQGMPTDSPERFQAAVLYVIQESANEGHVFITRQQIMDRVYSLLGEEAMESFSLTIQTEAVANLLKEKKVMVEEDRYYLPSLFHAENQLSLKIKSLLQTKPETEYTQTDVFRILGEIEEQLKVSYADKQRDAIMMALSTSFMILTGGPGTGKTTVIQGICQLFSRLEEISLDPADYLKKGEPYPIRLVAPTGRAAKRMTETTGLPSMTIHRLLGWKGDFFEHHADHPIQGRLLIVDEVSMLDTWLANQLFRSIPSDMQVILVGDQDQLPSVGPGKVLHHLLQVPTIQRVELDEIFRQEEGSSIIDLAHSLRKGEVPTNLVEPFPDRRFFPCHKEEALSIILQTVANAYQKGFTPFDVQVLAPIYKGPVGVDRINQEIQRLINPKQPDRKEIEWGESVFRLQDKVLQLVNHSEHNVYNGDMGKVIAIDETASADEPVLWVQFDRREVPYQRNQLGQLSLAYACSVHKAQGSEFPIVIFPVLSPYRRMLERNLIYTAITRSKSYLILLGEPSVLRQGVSNQQGYERNSHLCELIMER